MASPGKLRTGLVLVAALGCAGLAWQHRTNTALREELARRQERARERAGLERENQRLRAAQVSPEQLAAWTDERAALASLANEFEVLRRRAAAAPAIAVAAAEPTPRPSLRQAHLAANEWRNAGDQDPLSTLETALWAAAHGEIATLTRLLSVSEPTRTHAAAVLARLPAAARGDFGSPEQLVAMLTANAVPLGNAHVAAQFQDAPETARLVLQLIDLEGQPRERVLTLRATEQGWRLAVPDAEIQKHFVALQKPAAP